MPFILGIFLFVPVANITDLALYLEFIVSIVKQSLYSMFITSSCTISTPKLTAWFYPFSYSFFQDIPFANP